MRLKHLSFVALMFALLFSSAAPIKAEGTGYAKWLMAGIGCLAATVFSYPWIKAGYWGYKITKELPKTDDSGSMSLTQAVGYLQLIKAAPELHTEDGVKTFAWGHHIQQNLKKLGIVLPASSNQASYLRLLHALHLRNQKLRETDKTIKDLRAESEDRFIVWVYLLQQKIKEHSDATTPPMTLDEQVNSVMLLHQLPHLHNEQGIHVILFALRIQKELQAKHRGNEAPMSDADKKYYLDFLSTLFNEVPGGIPKDAPTQSEWIKTIIIAKRIQQEINNFQNTLPIDRKAASSLAPNEKIDFVKFLHHHRLTHEPLGEFYEEDAIEVIVGLYRIKACLPNNFRPNRININWIEDFQENMNRRNDPELRARVEAQTIRTQHIMRTQQAGNYNAQPLHNNNDSPQNTEKSILRKLWESFIAPLP